VVPLVSDHGSGGWLADDRSDAPISRDEIRAIVNETTERRTYTSAHCHPASRRATLRRIGVRVIEHGTLMDDQTAKFVAGRERSCANDGIALLW